MTIALCVDGNFGELIGCVVNTSAHITIYQAYQCSNAIKCIDYCLKYEAPYAGKLFFTTRYSVETPKKDDYPDIQWKGNLC